MRLRTALVLVGLCVALGTVVLVGFGVSTVSGTFTEAWVSDTPRNNTVNHHAVGVGTAGDIVVAPVAEVPYGDTEITDTSCALVRLAPERGDTTWRAGMPADDCFTHALTEPAISDVDGDGDTEVIVATTENALVTRDAATGREEWRIPLTTYGYGRPTVADVLPAAGPEVVTSDIRGGVVLAHGNGTVAWRTNLTGPVSERATVWVAPVIRDFDADDAPEILVGTKDGPVVLAADGAVEWTGEGTAEYVAVAQADDDPAVEIFTSGTEGIQAYDGATGERQWEQSVTNARIRTATDGDDDGTVEVYAGFVGGEVRSLDATTGDTEWSTTLSTTDDVTVLPPVLGDTDGDGNTEVVMTMDTGLVVALDAASGAERATYQRSVPVYTFATLGDIDDDGSDEVLIRYGDGRVVALDWASPAGPV